MSLANDIYLYSGYRMWYFGAYMHTLMSLSTGLSLSTAVELIVTVDTFQVYISEQ